MLQRCNWRIRRGEIQQHADERPGPGEDVDAICADAGVKPERLPPFSLSTETLPDKLEDRVALRTLKELAFTTPWARPASQRIARRRVRIICRKRLPVDEAK